MSTGKTVAIILGTIVGLAVLCVALCGGFLFWGFSSAGKLATPRIDAVFAAIENDTLGNVYDTMTTAEFRGVTSRQGFQELGDTIATQLGKLQSKSIRSFNMQQNNAVSTIDVSYEAQFEKGPGTITATLRKEQGEWLFLRFRVTSPNLQQQNTAPDAGELPEFDSEESMEDLSEPMP